MNIIPLAQVRKSNPNLLTSLPPPKNKLPLQTRGLVRGQPSPWEGGGCKPPPGPRPPCSRSKPRDAASDPPTPPATPVRAAGRGHDRGQGAGGRTGACLGTLCVGRLGNGNGNGNAQGIRGRIATGNSPSKAFLTTSNPPPPPLCLPADVDTPSRLNSSAQPSPPKEPV